MNLRKKKGFTIIELVIVIAVIGILTAVLVPTFINLTAKANEASDNSLVKNLNTALKMEEQTAGHQKAPTLQGAIDDLENQGYLLENIVAKSGQDLLWNQEKNEFVLNKENEYSGSNFWKIVDQLPALAEQKYAYYAGKNFNATEVANFKYGFDAGDHDGITTINYTNATSEARTVAVRTNGTGTTLTVDAPLDTVHHYDYLDGLTVTAVADASYHEHGTVRGKAVLSQGHIEVEEGAKVPEVSVENVPDGKTAKVTAKTETLVSVDTASATKATVVAEAENVYVTGVSSDKISGSKADKVELPTAITSEAELAAAITAKKAFLQLGANFTAEDIYVINNETLIDFAGYTITATKIGTSQSDYKSAIDNETPDFTFVNTPFLTNKSTLTITDTKGNGGITSSNNIIVNNLSNLTFNGGKLNSTILIDKYNSSRNGLTENGSKDLYRKALNSTILRGVLLNSGDANLTFNDGCLESSSDYAFLNYGNAVFNGGDVISHADNATSGYGYAFAQKDGNITVNYVHINGVHGCFGFNGGKAVVNDALTEFAASGNKFYSLYIAGEVGYPEVTINGGIYNPGGSNVVYVGNKNDGGAGNLAMANIYGGTFNGGIYATLTSANNYGIGMLRLYGGSYKTTLDTHLIADGYHTIQDGDYQVVVK